jgi:hypothetical protein
VCCDRDARIGALCETCRGELLDQSTSAPEQTFHRSSDATTAALVDRWGRAFRLDPVAMIGRDHAANGLVIREPHVSREHAVIERRAEWTVSDLGSANATFVDGVQVEGTSMLADRSRVRFGFIEMYFVANAAALPRPGRAASPTIPSQVTSFELRQPTGGGGGVVEINGTAIQLTVPQYELVSTLFERRSRDDHGFMHASELLALLSLEAAEPSEDSVRHVVRRVRRLAHRAGIGELIESRPRMGYRLAIPRVQKR